MLLKVELIIIANEILVWLIPRGQKVILQGDASHLRNLPTSPLGLLESSDRPQASGPSLLLCKALSVPGKAQHPPLCFPQRSAPITPLSLNAAWLLTRRKCVS